MLFTGKLKALAVCVGENTENNIPVEKLCSESSPSSRRSVSSDLKASCCSVENVSRLGDPAEKAQRGLQLCSTHCFGPPHHLVEAPSPPPSLPTGNCGQQLPAVKLTERYLLAAERQTD